MSLWFFPFGPRPMVRSYPEPAPLPPTLAINPILEASAPRDRTLSLLVTSLVFLVLLRTGLRILEQERRARVKAIPPITVPILLTMNEPLRLGAEPAGGGQGQAADGAESEAEPSMIPPSPIHNLAVEELPERLDDRVPMETPKELPMVMAVLPSVALPGAKAGHGLGGGKGEGSGNGSGSGRGHAPTWLHPAKGGQNIQSLDSVMDAVVLVPPVYPRLAILEHISGDVIFEVTVDPRGKPLKTKPLEGNPYLLDAVLRVLPRWRFAPIIYQGQAVSATFEIRIRFTLRQN